MAWLAIGFAIGLTGCDDGSVSPRGDAGAVDSALEEDAGTDPGTDSARPDAGGELDANAPDAIDPSACVPGAWASPLPAFPGAEGYGTQTRGGRGGIVCEVTRLDDAPSDPQPGTLRHCLAVLDEPRIVVFRTGGTIVLRARILINPDVTIAGQTAPGDGIQIVGDPAFNGSLLDVDDHRNEARDVVMRHLRVRRGPHDVQGASGRAITLSGAERVVLDHISASFGTDTTIQLSRIRDVTVQWTLVSWPLHCGYHGPGECHAYAMGIGGNELDRGDRVSLHHTLFAHLTKRAPQIGHGIVDVRNVLILNATGAPQPFRSVSGATRINYVGNAMFWGMNNELDGDDVESKDVVFLTEGSYPLGVFYDDFVAQRRDGTVQVGRHGVVAAHRHLLVDAEYDTPAVTTHTAAELDAVLTGDAGAYPARRDSIDTILFDDLNGARALTRVSHPDELPFERATHGFSIIDPGEPVLDSDHDGMPDAWERAHGFDPDDPTDGGAADRDGDGYTNVEEAINGTLPDCPGA